MLFQTSAVQEMEDTSLDNERIKIVARKLKF